MLPEVTVFDGSVLLLVYVCVLVRVVKVLWMKAVNNHTPDRVY